MQTNIHPDIIKTDEGREADRILRTCVHCGFCTAVCPTYQLLGDELDGPRGRIYLIKEMLETGEVAAGVSQHIDRCLTCRACETACPSGVEYGRLVDIGRGFIADHEAPGLRRRLLSALLRWTVPRPHVFGPMLRGGQLVRRVLPGRLRALVPGRRRVDYPTTPEVSRRVIVLQGCVQRSATPNVNRALAYLLGKHGIGVEFLPGEGCCGALDYHFGAQDRGLERIRALIDVLLPRLDDVDAIVSTASGCGVTVKEYGQLLAGDAAYVDKAERVAAACVDASELLSDMEFEAGPRRVACHVPCTLQHGQKSAGFESILRRAGLETVQTQEAHLCCGSAGAWSILEPTLSTQLRDRKRAALGVSSPDIIATANIGCQLHLDGGDVPVVHWLELLADQVRLLEQPPE